MGTCASGRKFVVTKAGYMGMVPPKSEIGDVVPIILGARTTLLLRKSTDSSPGEESEVQPYELVGGCYIHGMMNGEAMDESYQMESILLV